MGTGNDDKGRKPSVAHRLRGVERAEFYGNVSIGYDSFLDAEHSTDISSHDNLIVGQSTGPAQLRQLLQLLDSGLRGVAETDATRELRAQVATLRTQVESPRPERSIIRSALLTVRGVLVGAAGEVLAQHFPQGVALIDGLLRSLP